MVNKLSDKYECPFDIYLLKFIDTHLHIYHELGLTPNIITTFSIKLGLLSAYQIIKNRFNTAALLMLCSYYFDCVDGKLARKYNMVTKFGDMYDHIGDLLKVFAIMYALFYTTKKLNSKQFIYIGIILILALLQFIHLGYQETIYINEESGFLNMCKNLVFFDKTPEKSISYTRYFGCGTWMLCFALLIIFWRK
jgi:phosphatidylglycerophosphate synthase